MTSCALNWGATALERQLQRRAPGLRVEVQASLPSTSTTLLERLRRAANPQPCLLVAEQQTQGRGRLGREWRSAAGASLTFSLALALAPRDWAGLSLAVGMALADALDAAEPPRIGLKWPNDLWLIEGPGRGRKLGGILIETLSVGAQRLCVAGVGLNVLPQPAQGLTHGYACLQEMDTTASCPRVLVQVAMPLLQALQRFEAESFAPRAGAYARRDLLLGHAVQTTLPELPVGVAEGVDERGALRVRHGALHHVVSGEVSVRLQAAAVPGPG